MFGGGEKKEKKEEEDRGDVSGSAKAQREAAEVCLFRFHSRDRSATTYLSTAATAVWILISADLGGSRT
jgi:hypothetical protein